MWTVILATLRLALTPLTIAASLLENLDTNKEGIDDDIAAALKEAIRVIQSVIATETPTPNGQARGLVAISNFCKGVIAKLDEILSHVPPYSDEEKQTAADANASLFDEAKVYQAQRGEDARVLREAKAESKEKLGIILQTG